MDILTLTETHHFLDQQLLVILGYQHFAVASPCNVDGQVRKHSGGILIYVSELCSIAISVWKVSKDGTRLWLKFTDLGNSKPLFLCITYVPPQNSPYINKALYDRIAQEIAKAESTPCSVILARDFNARTCEEADSVDCTSLCNALQIPELQDTRPPPQLRQNRGLAAPSGWYKELLGLCGAIGYRILNGRIAGYLTREYTCLANHGHSIVDYMIASPEMFEVAQHLEVLTDLAYCGSKQSEFDHLPLALRFVMQFSTFASTFDNNTPSPMIRFKYTPAFADEYCTQLQHSLSIDTDVLHLQDMPATNLAEFLHNHICNVANNVFGQKQPPSAHRHCHKPWFDTECRVEKRHVMTFLKDNPESEFARTLQRNLKQLFKRKKRSYEKLRGMRLCKMAKADPAGFWRRYRAQKEAAHDIGTEALRQDFAALLGSPSSTPDPVVPAPASDVDGCTLSQDIQLCEIVDAIKKLKRGKAAGLDGVKAEFVIDGCDALLRILQTLFNKLLSEGFCSSLAVGVIHALFKSGDASSVDNYRRITVDPVIAKLFAMVLKSRFSSWAQRKGIRAHGQARFRQDYRTTDNLFVL